MILDVKKDALAFAALVNDSVSRAWYIDNSVLQAEFKRWCSDILNNTTYLRSLGETFISGDVDPYMVLNGYQTLGLNPESWVFAVVMACSESGWTMADYSNASRLSNIMVRSVLHFRLHDVLLSLSANAYPVWEAAMRQTDNTLFDKETIRMFTLLAAMPWSPSRIVLAAGIEAFDAHNNDAVAPATKWMIWQKVQPEWCERLALLHSLHRNVHSSEGAPSASFSGILANSMARIENINTLMLLHSEQVHPPAEYVCDGIMH